MLAFHVVALEVVVADREDELDLVGPPAHELLEGSATGTFESESAPVRNTADAARPCSKRVEIWIAMQSARRRVLQKVCPAAVVLLDTRPHYQSQDRPLFVAQGSKQLGVVRVVDDAVVEIPQRARITHQYEIWLEDGDGVLPQRTALCGSQVPASCLLARL